MRRESFKNKKTGVWNKAGKERPEKYCYCRQILDEWVWRSPKVNGNAANRLAMCSFLLVVCSNHFSNLQRFRDITTFWRPWLPVCLNCVFSLVTLKLFSRYDLLFVDKCISASWTCIFLNIGFKQVWIGWKHLQVHLSISLQLWLYIVSFSR